jgi:glycosyltransferase involved in cell wall biosynthesis
MIIGFDAKRIFYNKTGLGNYARSLLIGLNQLNEQNNYHLFTPGFRIHQDFLANVPQVIRHVPSKIIDKKVPSLWRSSGMVADIKKANIQIFHGLSNELPKGLGQTEIKTVVSIHDLIFLKFPHLYPWLDRQIYKKKFAQAIHSADLVLATSENTKQDILHYYEVNPQKIEVLYQNCDPSFQHKLPLNLLDQTKRKYDLRRDYILSVGTLEQRKNHLQLLQAFVESDLHDTDLVLLGKKADAYPALIKFVMEHNLQERVKFIHDASFDHFPALYQASLGLVYVSKYEGFGIPILEAMQSGVPVMAGTLSSLPEVAGKAAIYAHPDDLNELKNGLNQLVYDQTKRIEILAQAQKQLPLFSTERMSKQLLMHYQQLIS